MMNNFKKIKCFFKRLNPFYKDVKIDISLYQDDFVLLDLYSFSDRYNKGLYHYLGRGKFRDINNKFRVSTINHSKIERKQRIKARNWLNRSMIIYCPKGQEFSLDVSTGYPNSFYFEVSAYSDNNFTIHFWFIFNIFFSIKKLPKWYMDWFSKRLKRYSYSKRFSLSFHHWKFWWNFWSDGEMCINKNKWRKGRFDIKIMIAGDYVIKKDYYDFFSYKIFFKEGSYEITSIASLLKKQHKRFGFIFNKKHKRFEITTGVFEQIKKVDELKEYKFALIDDGKYDSIKRILLTEKEKITRLELDPERTTNLYKIDKINKDTKIVTMHNKEKFHWGSIKAIIKEETGVPVPGDNIYSLGGGNSDNHYSAIGKFQALIFKERYSGDWSPYVN